MYQNPLWNWEVVLGNDTKEGRETVQGTLLGKLTRNETAQGDHRET